MLYVGKKLMLYFTEGYYKMDKANVACNRKLSYVHIVPFSIVCRHDLTLKLLVAH